MLNIKTDIVKYLRESYKLGWITAKDGNISVLHNNNIYISKSGINKNDASINDIVSFKINSLVYPKEASIETKLHHNVYLNKGNEARAVIHVHAPYTLGAIRYYGESRFLNEVMSFPEVSRYTKVGSLVGYIDPGDHLLAQMTAKYLEDSDIVGLLDHGVVAKGKTLEEAFQHIERLEHVCKILFLGR